MASKEERSCAPDLISAATDFPPPAENNWTIQCAVCGIFRVWIAFPIGWNFSPPLTTMEFVSAVLAPIDAINAVVAAPLGLIADPIGFLTLDKAKYLFCTLLCYGLSVVYRMLPNKPTIKVWNGLYFDYLVNSIHREGRS